MRLFAHVMRINDQLIRESQAMDAHVPSIASIDQLREAAGLPRSALYRQAGVSHRTYYDALAGRRDSNIRTLRKLAEALHELTGEARQ